MTLFEINKRLKEMGLTQDQANEIMDMVREFSMHQFGWDTAIITGRA